MLYPFPYFSAFTWSTPVIPDLYWNAYSQEERIKNLCMEYGKLIAFTDAMVDTVNEQYEAIESINDNFEGYLADAIKNDPEVRKLFNDAVNGYLDSIMVSTTYGDLKQYGFATKKEGA